MQTMISEISSPHIRYCFTLPATTILDDVLSKDNELQRVVHRDGQCFACIEYQNGPATYRIRVASDPHYLHDHTRSYSLTIPAAFVPFAIEIPPQAGITYVLESAIPEMLLWENQTLEQAVRKHGRCFAMIEHQISWDLYCVRIAPKEFYLCDEEQTDIIYLSESQMKAYTDFDLESEEPSKITAPASPVVSSPPKHVDLKPLELVVVPMEDIEAAIQTVDLPENFPPIKLLPYGFKRGRRLQQIIELVLYRSLLHATAHKKALQKTIRWMLVQRKKFGRRLISLQDIYVKDGNVYWSLQVYLPVML